MENEKVIFDEEDEEEEIVTKNIRLMQYENLRKYFRENLIIPILGKDYYNMGMDVYSCDECTTEDLLHRFKTVESQYNLYLTLFRLSAISNIILIIWSIIN